MECPKSKEGLSRREFLSFIGKATAFAFLAQAGIPKKILAELEDVLKERPFLAEDFNAGIEELKKRVWSEKVEHAWIYLQKGAKRGWIDAAESATENSVWSSDLTPLLEDRDIARMDFVHIHPAILYRKNNAISKAELLEMQKTKRGKYPLVPSSYDIASLGRLKLLSEEKGFTAKFSALVVEPSGVWHYDVDMAHPQMRMMLVTFFEEANASLQFLLGKHLEDKREVFSGAEGVTSERLKEFQTFFREEWGIHFTYEANV